MIEGFRFQEPLWLWAALAGPLVLLIAWLRERQGRAVLFPGVSAVRALPRGWRLRLRHLPTLTFRADPSFDAANRIDQILRSPDVVRDLGERPAGSDDPED